MKIIKWSTSSVEKKRKTFLENIILFISLLLLTERMMWFFEAVFFNLTRLVYFFIVTWRRVIFHFCESVSNVSFFSFRRKESWASMGFIIHMYIYSLQIEVETCTAWKNEIFINGEILVIRTLYFYLLVSIKLQLNMI